MTCPCGGASAYECSACGTECSSVGHQCGGGRGRGDGVLIRCVACGVTPCFWHYAGPAKKRYCFPSCAIVAVVALASYSEKEAAA